MDNTPLNGQEIEDVVDLFIKENVLLYHGISKFRIPIGLSENIQYENKVRYCLTGAEEEGLSCSTIAPNDKIRVNFFEPVGLILKPIEILLCNNDDIGYSKNDQIRIYFEKVKNPTVSKIKSAIGDRVEMNEIVVSKYQVVGVGIYFSNPFGSNADVCIRSARELGIDRIIHFGKGFIDENGDSISAKDIY